MPQTDAGDGNFRSTLWSVVLRAKELDGPGRHEALGALIQRYRKPVYFFARRRGGDREAAKDLVQGFFAALLERNFLQYVERERGKFRTFLLTAFEHYRADERDRDRAQKRGGGRPPLPLDFPRADTEFSREPAAKDLDLARRYRRDWALQVLAQGLQALREAFEREGRREEFDALRFHLSYGAEKPPSYQDVAARLGVSENDVRNRVHRARARYKDAILEVIRAYTENPEEAGDELRELLSAFS
jgi:RNA polymerase sigma-70 factor (ECF subfamily)